MAAFVLDASVAISWCFPGDPDENRSYSQRMAGDVLLLGFFSEPAVYANSGGRTGRDEALALPEPFLHLFLPSKPTLLR